MGFSIIPWITLGGTSEVGILINLLTSDFPLTMHSSRSLSIEFHVMRCKEKRKGKKISLFRSFLGFVAKVFMELHLKKNLLCFVFTYYTETRNSIESNYRKVFDVLVFFMYMLCCWLY